ncbi:MAG TPA: TIGR03668 family PPOX class F420-dependent oxidoreductase [Blastocatellia bacterium]|nr:TIGR03668 family PPOX class F420-dependent oxidoreductase [Blastocatellia bacterium]
MALVIDQQLGKFIRGHRVARLATVDGDGRPAVIPICYVFDDHHFYSPLDEKPKQVAPRQLKRVRNIESNPHVALVIDDYADDWSKLAYVLVTGLAAIMQPGSDEHARAVRMLRDKYPQYRAMAIDERPMIKISPARMKHWKSEQGAREEERQ